MLTTIYVVRHAWRCDWVVDPITGKYKNNIQSPTGLDGDVPLAAYGVEQSKQLVEGLEALSPRASAIYSSPFYRCLETLGPYATKTNAKVQVDPGLGEWYGHARFTHPVPAKISTLAALFPFVNPFSLPTVVPSTSGESIDELYDRVAYALTMLIAREDSHMSNEDRAILICTHAASMIAVGRVLTGDAPEDPATDDFKTFTAGISTFKRRQGSEGVPQVEIYTPGQKVPEVGWKGQGVVGGWDMTVNSDCSHLSGGPQKGWSFAKAESYD